MNAQTPPPENETLSLNDQILQRHKNLEAWRQDGVEPFGCRVDGIISAVEAKGRYVEGQADDEGAEVTVAGRMTACRTMGKSIFADITDSSDRVQLYAQKNVLGEEAFDHFKRLDLGDIFTVTGQVFKTRMGEITIRVQSYKLLSKALLPLPEKWHGLTDIEQRYRQRYLDLATNETARDIFRKRVQIIREMRRYLEDRGFLEVETPMLQSLPGGAAARPFTTHYNALNCKMYMRIAPELYLKRLLVGGFERVFELNRNFRNEGLSRQHNPEFTMLEIYQAYGDCGVMMELVEDLITTTAEKVIGTLEIRHSDTKIINLKRPWRRLSWSDLIAWHGGMDWYEVDHAEHVKRGKTLELAVDESMTSVQIEQEIYEKLIEPTLLQPTFVTRLPRELVPLAKACPDDPRYVDVYELAINGQEISPGYSELNDPQEQRRRFEEQLKTANPEEIADKIDEDFLLAMEHGMPPAGGLGLGIDRLVMMLTGAETIREVILFPQMRPRS